MKVLIGLAVAAPLLAIWLDRSAAPVESFHLWLHRADPLLLLEALILALVGVVSGAVYAFRRWRDLVREIQRRKAAEAEVKTLRGLIPICSFCRLIRDPDGQWQSLEEYLHEHSEARLTHGMCPGCAETRWLQ